MKIFEVPVSVHLILIKNQKILLMKRKNTGFADGLFCLPAGKLEENENTIEAMIREAKEELDINIKKENIKVVQVMNRKGNDKERIDYFFISNKYEGKIKNNETNKCEILKWFDLDKLPNDIVPYIKLSIENYQNDVKFSFFGW